ncbi:MAG: hypothetical protein AAF348_19730, partial [Bacteroidota bacterium]
MKRTLIFCFLPLIFISNLMMSQGENLALPEVDVDMDLPTDAEVLLFYVNGNEELYFSEKRLQFWDEVSSSILAKQREQTFNKIRHIIIHADKNIPYRFVQRLRSEIGKVWSGFLHFKGGKVGGKKGISVFIAGSEITTERKNRGGDFVFSSNIIYTRGEKDGTVNVQRRPGSFFPIPAIWQNNFSRDLFNRDTVHIKETLKQIDYKALEVYSEDEYKVDGKGLKFENTDELKLIMDSNDLILLKFNFNFTYGQFMKTMGQIQNLRLWEKDSFHGELRKPFIIDVI